MKNAWLWIMILIISIATSACAITGGNVRLSTPGVEIGVEGGSSGAVHCPPGQAKKGNC